MPDQILFANNAISTLASAIGVSATVLPLAAGTGELFPSPGVGEYFKLTIEDRRTQQIEITHCIGRSADSLTVVRAQEDTTALAFLAGATVSNRMTRDTADAILDQVPNPNPWYLGPFASAPTTDNDGNPLAAGQQYFNTANSTIYAYTGASWLAMNTPQVAAGMNALGVFVIPALAAFDGVTTAFAISYTDYSAVTASLPTTISEQLLIFVDNVQQKPGTDFTLTALGTITFAVAPPADAQFWGLWVAPGGSGVNPQTGTAYTSVANDAGKTITMNNASANVVTIPANASVPYPIGTKIDVVQLGAGQTSFAITTDTLNSRSSWVKISARYGRATLTKVTATSWVLSGDLAA